MEQKSGGVKYDCRKCGACCSYKWSWPVLKRDLSDAGGIPKSMIRDDYPIMKTTKNRCIALSGEVGKFVSCTVHDCKPFSCKNFEPGSALCLEARNAAGIQTKQ
jgi:Fe-S-cluster containining protein